MYRGEDFRAFFRDVVGATPATVNTYSSFLKRIDEAIGGLDEAVAEKGVDGVLEWANNATERPFDVYSTHARAVLRRYLRFLTEPQVVVENIDPPEINNQVEGSFFRLEREMQLAVRSQLDQLESGLREDDGGSEIVTATGRPDIVARDKTGKLVAIELKAGLCPAGALEQVLGYAQSLTDEKGESVRAILIASEFPDRIKAAAKRVPDLVLYRYRFEMRFGVA